MLTKLRARLRRPSPATAIAVIALFVALGGTGYAALKLPSNSVGTKQLKNNAVTGAKVKNGSLAAADFGGTLPAGAKGDKGDPGTNGTNGTNGAKGDKGDPGTNGTGTPGTNGTNGAALVAHATCLGGSGCPVSSAHANTPIPLTGDTTWTQASGDAGQVDVHLEWQPASVCTGGTGSQVTIEDNAATIVSFPTPPSGPAQVFDRTVHLFSSNGTSHVLTAHVADNCTGGGPAEQGTVGQLKIDAEQFVVAP
jgi:hypothetical protein